MYDGRKLIVTLTSIPSRMEYLHIALHSLLTQTVKVDRVVLSLPHESIREKTGYVLSKEVQSLVDSGRVELLRCKDYGPATKLLGVLEQEMGKKESIEPFIFFFDDDRAYHSNAVEILLRSGLLDRGHAACRMGSIIYQNPWGEERICSANIRKPEQVDILLGYSGVAVRPSHFDERVFKHEVKDSFFVDDIHLSGNLRRNGVKLFVPPAPPTKWQIDAGEAGFLETDPALVSGKINPLHAINHTKLDHTFNTLKHFKLPR